MNLFQQEVINNDKNGAIKVISDQDEKQTYTKEEVLNSVIWGDALKVLKKMPEEIFDMVFIDPPYFLQLLAEYLQLDEHTIYRLARKGEIPALKIGAEWRFKKDLIDKWIEKESLKTFLKKKI